MLSIEGVLRFNEAQMAANACQEIIDRREQLLDEELDKFVNGTNTGKYETKTYTLMLI